MNIFQTVSTSLIMGVLFCVAPCMISCATKPNRDQLSALEEARNAAESAERKLSQLRRERQELEKQLKEKEQELSNHENERDQLQ